MYSFSICNTNLVYVTSHCGGKVFLIWKIQIQGHSNTFTKLGFHAMEITKQFTEDFFQLLALKNVYVTSHFVTLRTATSGFHG